MQLYYMLIAFFVGSFLGFLIGGLSAGSRILNMYDEMAELKSKIIFLEEHGTRDVSTQER